MKRDNYRAELNKYNKEKKRASKPKKHVVLPDVEEEETEENVEPDAEQEPAQQMSEEVVSDTSDVSYIEL